MPRQHPRAHRHREPFGLHVSRGALGGGRQGVHSLHRRVLQRADRLRQLLAVRCGDVLSARGGHVCVHVRGVPGVLVLSARLDAPLRLPLLPRVRRQRRRTVCRVRRRRVQSRRRHRLLHLLPRRQILDAGRGPPASNVHRLPRQFLLRPGGRVDRRVHLQRRLLPRAVRRGVPDVRGWLVVRGGGRQHVPRQRHLALVLLGPHELLLPRGLLWGTRGGVQRMRLEQILHRRQREHGVPCSLRRAPRIR
mmetsp:Transcript_31265/g.74253  ORF Transcript_31265/g.74253 Transcript_31265/m.74253 type:complete len:249 (+) Transcript_31265:232-978(+)